MSDQTAPVEPDTPNDAPSEGGEPQIPAGFVPEDRYKEAQAWGTRASQEAAQYRQLVEGLQSDDPDTRLWAAQQLGIEFQEDPDTNIDPDDPLAEIRQELEQIKRQNEQYAQRFSQQDQQSQLQQLEQVADSALKSLGVPEEIQDWVVSRAVALDSPDLAENIKAAWEEYTNKVRTWEQAQWKSTKRAPHVSAVGQPGSQAPNLDDPQERQRWMMAQLEDMES